VLQIFCFNLDEDDHSVDNATRGSNANVGADVEE